MARLSKLLKLFDKCERGAVLPLVALLIVFLFGMAALTVDAGGLYSARREMVNTADAAALAGAQELAYASTKGLSNEQVEQYAEDFARDNYHGELIDVQAEVINHHTVGVMVEREVDFTFARIIGFTTSEVPAYAVATFTPLAAGANIVPWGVPAGFLPDGWDGEGIKCNECGETLAELEEEVICDECDELSKVYVCENPDCDKEGVHITAECGCDNYIVLKVGPPGGGGSGGEIGPGNFHALALGGDGADTYRDNIKDGYQGVINLYDWLDTEPGNMAGPTEQGVQDRIDRCNCHDSFQENGTICSNRGCPRFVTTPVFSELVTVKPGKTQVQVIAFATFYLVDHYKEGSTHIVRALFVEEYFGDGTGSDSFDPSANFGTYNLRLIE